MGGAAVLLAALFLPWYELRLYSWQGGCCSADIDNPSIRLGPLASQPPYYGDHMPGRPLYAAVAAMAVVAIAAGLALHRRVLAGAAAVASVLITAGAILAFDVGPPQSYGADFIVVRMVPMWGLAAGIAASFVMAAGAALKPD